MVKVDGSASCPSDAELERHFAGLSSDRDGAGIAAHVDRCDRCRTWLEQARADEALLGDIQRLWRQGALTYRNGGHGTSALGSRDEVPAASERTERRGLPTASDRPPPSQIGGYRILRKLGEGGMGIVYEAEQERPRRTVALKVLRPGAASNTLLRRFEHEAHVLARLQHPGIAQIYEAGTAETDGGPMPFFAMELIEGRPLVQYASERKLDTRARLELLEKVCHAVQHAHAKGVIHRDLKPGNILVTPAGQPKVLDFGVARLTDADVQVTTLHTDVGQVIGTLAYMSPEQVLGDPAAVDTRSDVYSLGVIGYELLTGRLPYDLGRRPLHEAARIIREEEPTALRTVDKTLRGDVETILFKALEKDRSRRYQSVVELSQDIRLHLNREPIMARPPTWTYRVGKLVARHRTAAALTGLLVVCLIGATVVSTLFALDARRRHAESLEAAAVARHRAYLANVTAAAAALEIPNVLTAAAQLRQAPPEFRNWEWHYLASQLDLSLRTLRGHERPVWWVAFSPDGTRVTSCSGDWSLPGDSTVRLWDRTSGAELRRFEGHRDEVTSVAFHPDGRELASASVDATVRFWDVESGAETGTLQGHEGRVNTVAYAPDGSWIVSGSADGTVRIWDCPGRRQRGLIRETGAVFRVAVGPEGNSVAVVAGGGARLWDVAGGKLVRTIGARAPTGGTTALAFSPDGRTLAGGTANGAIQLWSRETGEVLREWPGHGAGVTCVAFDPAGDLLVSGSEDRTLKVWDLESGRALRTLHGHPRGVRSVAVAPDGSCLATAGANEVKLWDPQFADVPALRGHSRLVRCLAFSSGGEWLVSGGRDGTVRVWDVSRRREVTVLSGATLSVMDVACLGQGRYVAAAALDRKVRLWRRERLDAGSDGSAPQFVSVFEHQTTGATLAIGPDDCHVAFLDADLVVKCLDVRTLEMRPLLGGRKIPLAERPRDVLRLAFSPDGLTLACATLDRVELLDVGTGERRAVLGVFHATNSRIAFSRDGTRIATSSGLDKAMVWDAATGAPVATLVDALDVYDLAFSPDGTRLASASYDGEIRLWDGKTGHFVVALRGTQHPVWAVAFSPDGTRLASGHGSYNEVDCVIRLREIGPPDLADGTAESESPADSSPGGGRPPG